jgi:uncharacterized surface protein with fasciclin (FAS1) repeats
MRLKYHVFPFAIILFFTAFATSCVNEAWDEHYNTVQTAKSDKNLYEYIKSQENLSKFSEMLELVGYDTILNKSHSFTVWAPDNAALEGVSTSDLTEVRKLVENHITRYMFTTSGLKSKTVMMVNAKLIEFSKTGGVSTLAGKVITTSDIAVSNGILHILGEFAPYRKNLWEFINKTEGLDSLRVYINSLTKLEFDESASYEDGVLIDSIKTESNAVLANLAALNVEDSIYTAILPDNAAWSEAYARIYPFFKTLPALGGETTQRELTKWTLVQDLFFRNRITLPVTADTLTSTNLNKFANPARLFQNSQQHLMSNGYSYVTSKLNSTANESWFKEIRIEAENNRYGRLTSNYNVSTLSGLGTGYDISFRNYAYFTDASQSSISTLFVSFPIPNTLSGKYNIYCVFVPTKIVDTTDVRPYKVKFSLKYTNSTGQVVNFGAVTATNEVKTPSTTKATFTTNPDAIDKMLVVKDFEFPYSNIIDFTDANFINGISVALKVENATPKTPVEMVKFNRNLRIDCIILEPVQ